MQVIGKPDGSFVFEFGAGEKGLGVQILQSIKAPNYAVQRAIEQSIQEILWAGFDTPSQTVN